MKKAFRKIAGLSAGTASVVALVLIVGFVKLQFSEIS
jgi:hypothetical protein